MQECMVDITNERRDKEMSVKWSISFHQYRKYKLCVLPGPFVVFCIEKSLFCIGICLCCNYAILRFVVTELLVIVLHRIEQKCFHLIAIGEVKLMRTVHTCKSNDSGLNSNPVYSSNIMIIGQCTSSIGQLPLTPLHHTVNLTSFVSAAICPLELINAEYCRLSDLKSLLTPLERKCTKR